MRGRILSHTPWRICAQCCRVVTYAYVRVQQQYRYTTSYFTFGTIRAVCGPPLKYDMGQLYVPLYCTIIVVVYILIMIRGGELLLKKKKNTRQVHGLDGKNRRDGSYDTYYTYFALDYFHWSWLDNCWRLVGTHYYAYLGRRQPRFGLLPRA